MNEKFSEFIRNWWFMIMAVAGMGAWAANMNACVDNLSDDVHELLQLERRLEVDVRSFMSSTDTWIESHKEIHDDK